MDSKMTGVENGTSRSISAESRELDKYSDDDSCLPENTSSRLSNYLSLPDDDDEYGYHEDDEYYEDDYEVDDDCKPGDDNDDNGDDNDNDGCSTIESIPELETPSTVFIAYPPTLAKIKTPEDPSNLSNEELVDKIQDMLQDINLQDSFMRLQRKRIRRNKEVAVAMKLKMEREQAKLEQMRILYEEEFAKIPERKRNQYFYFKNEGSNSSMRYLMEQRLYHNLNHQKLELETRRDELHREQIERGLPEHVINEYVMTKSLLLREKDRRRTLVQQLNLLKNGTDRSGESGDGRSNELYLFDSDRSISEESFLSPPFSPMFSSRHIPIVFLKAGNLKLRRINHSVSETRYVRRSKDIPQYSDKPVRGCRSDPDGTR